MGAAAVIIPLFIVIAIVIRLMAGGMDHDRIREYVESRGGRYIDSSWTPFGPGWFGEKSDRIYLVRYVDAEGNEHEAHCKTSMMTGVYFTEDRIVRHAKPTGAAPLASSPPAPAASVEALEAENRRLREELERVRRERGEA